MFSLLAVFFRVCFWPVLGSHNRLLILMLPWAFFFPPASRAAWKFSTCLMPPGIANHLSAYSVELPSDLVLTFLPCFFL